MWGRAPPDHFIQGSSGSGQCTSRTGHWVSPLPLRPAPVLVQGKGFWKEKFLFLDSNDYPTIGTLYRVWLLWPVLTLPLHSLIACSIVVWPLVPFTLSMVSRTQLCALPVSSTIQGHLPFNNIHFWSLLCLCIWGGEVESSPAMLVVVPGALCIPGQAPALWPISPSQVLSLLTALSQLPLLHFYLYPSKRKKYQTHTPCPFITISPDLPPFLHINFGLRPPHHFSWCWSRGFQIYPAYHSFLEKKSLSTPL